MTSIIIPYFEYHIRPVTPRSTTTTTTIKIIFSDRVLKFGTPRYLGTQSVDRAARARALGSAGATRGGWLPSHMVTASFVTEDGVTINYELLEHPTFEIKDAATKASLVPIMVLVAGGVRSERAGLGSKLLRSMADVLLKKTGMRVVLYDQRNCGTSGCGFGDSLPATPGTQLQPVDEVQLHASDLMQLIGHAKGAKSGAKVCLCGIASGARVVLRVNRRHPGVADAIVLMQLPLFNLQAASQEHSAEYYGAYLDAAQAGGMPAVLDTPFFKAYTDATPGVKDALLRTPVPHFTACMAASAKLLATTSNLEVAALGVRYDDLMRVECPSAAIWWERGRESELPPSAATKRSSCLSWWLRGDGLRLLRQSRVQCTVGLMKDCRFARHVGSRNAGQKAAERIADLALANLYTERQRQRFTELPQVEIVGGVHVEHA